MMIGEILTRHGSDKDTYHSYGRVYDELFEPIRDKVLNLLEIGVCGGGSLKSWKEYFPNAKIIGLDINLEALIHPEDRIISYLCDATDPEQLNKILGGDQFDIIIDDGSHWESHQIASWQLLYNRVREGGLYIVEDIQHHGTAIKFEEFGARIYDGRLVKDHFDDMLAIFRKDTK
jgi:predicted O-methyltransferase YrrM